MKAARALLALGKVLSSNYTPPILKGVVQEGTTSYRAGLVLKSGIDLENMCTCRASREWGTICAHSMAVGLHHLKPAQVEEPRSDAQGAIKKFGALSASQHTREPRRLRRAVAGEPGVEGLELFLILPPNFAEAAPKGKVMLVLEGQWRKGRMPLNALPKEQPFQLSAEDERALSRVEALAGEPAGMMVITTREFTGLLPALAGHPRLSLGKTTPIKVADDPWIPPLCATLEANGEIVLQAGAQVSGPKLIEGWIFQQNTLQPLGLPAHRRAVLSAPVRLNRQQVPAFLNNDFPKLSAGGALKANFQLDDFEVVQEPPKIFLHLTGGLAQLAAQLQCKYAGRILTAGATGADASPWMPDPAAPTRYAMRDLAAEQQALGRLLRVGFTGPDGSGRYQLTGQERVLNFFAREFPRMQKEWEVTLEERLDRSAREKIERIEPRFEITPSGVQWFDFGVSFASSGGEQFSQADVQRLILSGQSHTRLKNGKVAVIDTGAVEELQQFLLDASPTQQQGRYRLGNVQAGFLESTLQQQGWQAQAPASWRGRAQQQSGTARLECPPLGELEKVLRPYQKHGVAWLDFLRTNGFGGILADEMGLGKTLQTLAFLQSLRSRRGQETRPGKMDFGLAPTTTLVVCPTSLVFNWVAEARKFTPQLKVLALHGANRHALFAEMPRADLVITSYALVRRDLEKYREVEFDTVVLDEAQHIKNRATQNAQAVKAIRSRNRLVLTGTPLENSVLDLWSIFDFLMPGYLGGAQDFKERYEAPIARDKNAEAQARLARRLKPFILRRLKRDVAADLPAKIEQITFCELNDEQRALYQKVMEFSRKEVLESVGAQGVAKSRMVIFTALLRLRQICCDLRLLNLEGRAGRESGERVESPLTPALSPLRGEGMESEGGFVVLGEDKPEEGKGTRIARPAKVEDSGKVEAFDELLQEIIDGGHRVLVFSQFVSMLSLLKQRLDAQQIEFCYLDGSTKDRGAVVEKFQKGSAPVFLISLKAGGVGLNLTGADTVVHFDPWWNPAVEAQATDRAHRIGQTRVVTSYKLITRGTVEEKILTLQQKKRDLIQATLGEEQLAEALNWDEIQELFS